ncbi:MAG: MATE family efflux transporter [Bacteroidota bacterium]|nr:MATE family efflux transporter [Bacteroidota bacterium]
MMEYLNSPVQKISLFFTQGHARSIKAKKNIAISIIIRGISIFTSFLLVPLCLHYIGSKEYGVWLTLSSIVLWVNFFDIGLGQGLRNKFAEAIAKGDKQLAKVYVSTTYAGILIIVSSLFLLILLFNPFISWCRVLNAPAYMSGQLEILVLFVFGFFLFRFVLGLLGIIITADQRPAISSSFDTLGNILALLIIFLLTKITKGSILYLGITLNVSPLLIFLIASFYFFNNDYKEYKPSLKSVDFKYFKELASLGIQFFIINIAVLVVFSSSNVIITQILGPEEVTAYNIAYKYFGMVTMFFGIIINPLWSAFTEAYVKEDFSWIKNTMKKLIQFWYLIAAGIIIMILLANTFYHLWVGKMVKVSFMLSAIMGIFIILSTWCNIWAYFINGTGKIRLSLYIAIFQAVVNIPLSIYFGKTLHLGSAGVVLGTCTSLIISAILAPIQYKKIVSKSDKGIWSK